MSSSRKQARPAPEHKKRHGLHHTKGSHYHKVYWPYLPLLLVIMLGVFVSGGSRHGYDVLAYSTDVSQQGLLDSTNTQRTAHGGSKLTLNERLQRAAQAKADDMSARNYWSHNTPDGQEPWLFLRQTGYEYRKAGENLAYGFVSNSATVVGWMNSASHRANLLDNAFSEVGFGYANVNNFQNKGEVTVIVAMYGAPLNGVPTPVAETAEPQQSKLQPVTSKTAVIEPAVKPVSRIEMMTQGRAPWIAFVVGLLGGISLGVLIIKHALALRRLLLKGEALFLHHPLLDAVLIGLLLMSIYLGQVTGFIA